LVSVQAALAHAQFETVHPFNDGNGRTGGALVQVSGGRRNRRWEAAELLDLLADLEAAQPPTS
jgi:fido (protein-threonine AMPylation protein)